MSDVKVAMQAVLDVLAQATARDDPEEMGLRDELIRAVSSAGVSTTRSDLTGLAAREAT